MFNPNVTGAVNTLTVGFDRSIFLGGLFTGVGGAVRNEVAHIYPVTGGNDTTFNPNVTSLGVNAMLFPSNGTIVIGG